MNGAKEFLKKCFYPPYEDKNGQAVEYRGKLTLEGDFHEF